MIDPTPRDIGDMQKAVDTAEIDAILNEWEDASTAVDASQQRQDEEERARAERLAAEQEAATALQRNGLRKVAPRGGQGALFLPARAAPEAPRRSQP